MPISIPGIRRVLFAVCMLVVVVRPVAAQPQQVVDEIVAVVADEIVLRSEVDGLVQNYVQQGQAPYTDELWVEMLNQIIDQKVMAVIAQRDTTIEITDDQVSQAIDQRIDQLQRQVGGRQEIERIYGKPIIEIRADLRRDFRNQLLAQRLQQEKVRNIRITPSEVREWFAQFPADSLPVVPESVRLSHIVRHPVITQEGRDEAHEIISAIRDSVVSGTSSIEDMARRFSDDPGSSERGGLYEETRLADLVPEFAAMAARSPRGEISQIFETQFGLHFLRVNERRGDVITYNHILIAFDRSKADPEPAIEYLTMVRDSIVTYDIPFGLMASRHSQEETSKSMGGRVIDMRTGERELFLEALGPSWRQTIDTMEVGEISHPARVQLLSGETSYHIVMLRDRKPTHQISFEDDYARIEQLALQEKQSEELLRWVRGLREQVYVDVRGKAREMLARN